MYVGPFVPSQPDMYWDPRGGQWVSLTPDHWQVTDKGLPQTGIDYPADHFFDELMDGWESMAPTDKAIAYWSPSKQRWLIATPRGSTPDGGTANEEMQKWLAELHQLYVKQLITYPVYQRAVADVLAGRPPSI